MKLERMGRRRCGDKMGGCDVLRVKKKEKEKKNKTEKQQNSDKLIMDRVRSIEWP
jgi:hypothetical protein